MHYKRKAVACGYGCRLETGASRMFTDYDRRLAHEVTAHGDAHSDTIRAMKYCIGYGCPQMVDPDGPRRCGPCRATLRQERRPARREP